VGLALLLAAAPAAAGDRALERRAPSLVGRPPALELRHEGRRLPSDHGVSARSESLDRFATERRLEARAEVRALQRENARRLEKLRLADEARPVEVERAAARWRREDAADALQTGVDLDALERRTGWPLGPVTREILATRLRPAARRSEAAREADLRALREAAEARARAGEPGPLEVPAPPEPGAVAR
jgi:hypothetical protein